MVSAASQLVEKKERFRARALLGFVIIIVLLGGGLTVDLIRLRAATNEELNRLHLEQAKLIEVERLRSSNMTVVSAVRGYFITGHDVFLHDMEGGDQAFDELVMQLDAGQLTAEARQLLDTVKRRAAVHRAAVHDLVAQKRAGADARRLTDLFEARIVTSAGDLGRAIDEFTQRRNEDAFRAHEADERALAKSLSITRWVIIALILLAVGFAWYYSRLLAQAYRALQRAVAEARSAAAARDELVAVVAHDLRNPLMAINLKASALRAGAALPEQHEQAEAIENITAQMSALTKTMLDVATIDAGRFAVAPARCDVDALMPMVHGMFEGAAHAKGVSLELKVAPGLHIEADWERLMQVFSNLIGNAVKFTPAGGRVTLAAEPAGTAVRFTIADTGPGIAADELPHVFDRFWRGGRKGKDGSGLGLFIAKGIIEAHGGCFGVMSTPGAGATFTFELPAA